MLKPTGCVSRFQILLTVPLLTTTIITTHIHHNINTTSNHPLNAFTSIRAMDATTVLSLCSRHELVIALVLDNTDMEHEGMLRVFYTVYLRVDLAEHVRYCIHIALVLDNTDMVHEGMLRVFSTKFDPIRRIGNQHVYGKT